MKPPFTFLVRFRKHVYEYPDAVALVDAEEQWTYRKLWNQAVQVANLLEQECSEEELIGVNIAEGGTSYVYLIGVWLSGKAYVSIDPNWPAERLKMILKESGVKFCWSRSSIADCGQLTLSFNEAEGIQNWELRSFDLAYVLFTSGSTGVPKGVKISVQNLEGFLRHFLSEERYDFLSSDRFLQSYDLTFDVSVMCYLLPWSIGATLYLPPKKGGKFLQLLKAQKDFEITVCSHVPSTLRYAGEKLSELSFPKLRYSFFSGDALYGLEAKRWLQVCPNAQVFNCYGPTETTIICTAEDLRLLDARYFEASKPLPLGAPFSGMDLQLIDGEICFSGDQVFPGYLNAFPRFAEKGGKRFYCTGDLAYDDVQGKLIFDGRRDDQVQIDGYRVELTEIEGVFRKLFSRLR